MFKVKNGIAPKILSGIFKLYNPTYNLRKKRDFVSNHVKTVYFGTESLSQVGSKLWDLLPQDLRTLTFLTQFKSQVKNGFRKTALAESAKYTCRMLALYNLNVLHLYAIYLIFIYLSIYLLNQLICNCCFIYFFIYILYS